MVRVHVVVWVYTPSAPGHPLQHGCRMHVDGCRGRPALGPLLPRNFLELPDHATAPSDAAGRTCVL